MLNFDIRKMDDYDDHKLVSCVNNNKTGLTGFIAIHRGNTKFPAFGATRLWNYETPQDALIDALRLSKTMSYKAALAGLKCGGAKAVLIEGGHIKNRKEFLRSYAEKINYFSGHFVTGADMGISQDDVKVMRRFSPYFVGIKVDPVRFTGLGLFYSIQACVKEVFGSEKLDNRSFAIQGVGKVGSEIIKLIYPYTKLIYVTDINQDTLKKVKEKFPKIKVVSVKEIYKQKVDVFSPCALSNCLNRDNVKMLKCSVIVGGANCQLEKHEVGMDLFNKQILYVPDYLVNAGGLISVYDEYEYKNTKVRRVIKRVKKIKTNVRKILLISKTKKQPPFKVADNLAKSIFTNYQ